MSGVARVNVAFGKLMSREARANVRLRRSLKVNFRERKFQAADKLI